MNAYETLIARTAIERLIEAGYYITVDYDGGYEPSAVRNINSTDDIPRACRHGCR